MSRLDSDIAAKLFFANDVSVRAAVIRHGY
jgi:hypothetical protein